MQLSLNAVIFWSVIGVIVIYTITVYNTLVNLKHGIAKAWSNIDILLRQRHDELPKLIESCKQYKDFEGSTLERIVTARNQVHSARERGDIHALGQAETQLRSGLGQIFAVAEAYPELRANENFQQLLARISQLEDAIADRREFYNESVNINNVRVESFPDTLVARVFGFGEKPLLRFASSEKADVDVKALFKP